MDVGRRTTTTTSRRPHGVRRNVHVDSLSLIPPCAQVLVLAAEKATDSWGVTFSFGHRMTEMISGGKWGEGRRGQMLAAPTRMDKKAHRPSFHVGQHLNNSSLSLAFD